MSKTVKHALALALVTAVGAGSAWGLEPWRAAALKAADRLAQAVEVLDETLHEAYEHHSTPAFKKAIEDIHHIEDVVKQMQALLPAGTIHQVCHEVRHLHSDLTKIRLDLIALRLQSNPKVVNAWNAMVHVHNHELIPNFRCPRHWSDLETGAVDNL